MIKPNCIGFIMDGNRRWAKERNFPTLKGHQEGSKRLKEIIKNASELGINNLIFYAFSTENWKRSEEEVSYLFKLMEKEFANIKEVHESKLKVKFIGERDKFSKGLIKLIENLEEDTKNYENGLVAIALSYGGRAEIVNAVNNIIKEGKHEEVNEEIFSNYLWTKNIPNPDLIIRTGEAMRLSNFLPWQSVYSELYFTSTYWPDFDKEELEYALEAYSERERRMGK
jgi:undecaprenyl diphosphate synthase